MRFLVVGGGIFGASAAFSLANAGAEVIVADDGRAGRATFAGAGIVCPWISSEVEPEFYALLRAGRIYYDELVPQLVQAGIGDTGFKKVGGLAIAQTEEQAVEIEARVAARVAAAPEAGGMHRLDEAAIRTLFPPLKRGLAAFLIPGGARVEARTVASALFHAARIKGATTLNGQVSLVLKGGRIEARVDGKEIAADRIVVTAGAWANQILSSIGAAVPVEAQKGQIMHLRLDGVDSSNWPVVRPDGPHYMLAFDNGHIVVGATRESGSGFDYRVTAAGQAEILNFALSIAPGLANATHVETRIGFRPYREPKKPLISRVDGIDNLFIGNGLGASGLTMGPIAGHLLAQLALDLPTEFDLSPYRLEPQGSTAPALQFS